MRLLEADSTISTASCQPATVVKCNRFDLGSMICTFSGMIPDNLLGWSHYQLYSMTKISLSYIIIKLS